MAKSIELKSIYSFLEDFAGTMCETIKNTSILANMNSSLNVLQDKYIIMLCRILLINYGFQLTFSCGSGGGTNLDQNNSQWV
jgi:hypothetical protein